MAFVSTYQDVPCNSIIAGIMVSDAPICLDVAAGATLRSMKASWLIDEPGSCAASGGGPTGEAKPLERRTFCCQPPHG